MSASFTGCARAGVCEDQQITHFFSKGYQLAAWAFSKAFACLLEDAFSIMARARPY